ncbi:hypothetical protein D3C85_1076070 [compost metagenome]
MSRTPGRAINLLILGGWTTALYPCTLVFPSKWKLIGVTVVVRTYQQGDWIITNTLSAVWRSFFTLGYEVSGEGV